MAVSQMVQSLVPRTSFRAGMQIGMQIRPRGGVRVRVAIVGPKLQLRGTKCVARGLGPQAQPGSQPGLQRSALVSAPSSSSSSSSSLMGASLWRTLVQVSESRRGGTLGTNCSIYVGGNGISPETVRWCVAAACTVLLLKRDAGAKKQFWAGILALEAPRDVLYWAKSEYGLWVACIGLALKIFYTLPAELDYPLAVYLFLVCLPAQAVAVRGTTGATVVSATLALFVAFQYFSNTVRFSDAFKGEHLVNTLLIVLTAVACIWFFGLTVL